MLIEVMDNGPGIDADRQGSLFSLFYRSKGEKGTGLGLAVTKNIIDEHKGRIWVESPPGAGAHFFVELPAQIGEQG